MSREIKFRGKHIHALSENSQLDGQWVYGYLCGGGNYIEPDDGVEKLIDESTVGQYTGLKDYSEYHLEVYEGDLIEVHFPVGTYKFEVKHHDEYYEVVAVNIDCTDDIYTMTDLCGLHFEVIGNIHESEVHNDE